ncbi:MAG TPA: POTRA domain-containing protein [Steroidobacteraceae bacterium]|nr:POTRA domain-containing protein [Steroidobacteraceae bacterium]
MIAILCRAFSALPAQGAEPTRQQDAVPQKDEYFDIAEFRVLGNSVLPVKSIERAVYPFAGPHKSIQDVQAARGALESAYHEAGYATVFVDIPEQDVSEGIVRLRATEGHLDRIRVSGIRYFSARKILAGLPEVKAGAVPRLPALQAELATVGAESADRAVTPVLKAGRTPGTVDLDLQVNDALPLHGGVAVNDRYTPDTSKLRSTVDLSYGNLFQDLQSIAFEYQTAPERISDEKVYSLTYVAPLWFGHNLLAAYAIDTNSNVAAVGALSLLGVGQVYGLHLIHPLPATGSLSQNVNFGADFKVFSQTVNVAGAPPDNTPIRYINWSLAYSLSEHTQQHDTSMSLTGNFGIRGLANDPAEFDFKRFAAQADYFYLRGAAERRDTLPWFGFSTDVRVAYQVADGPLISNEQFGLGGVDTVRGYIESIELGDNAITVQVELRGPTWTFGGDPLRNHFGLYAFYDAGVASILKPLPDQQSSFTLQSFGAGLRLIAFRRIDGTLDWAYPLRSAGTVTRGHSRVEFQLHFGF